MKGRKPKLAVIEGNRALDRCPSAPSWLSDEAKKEWRRVCSILLDRQVLGEDMLGVLEAYCVGIGIIREYQKAPRTENTLFSTAPRRTSPAEAKVLFAAMREVRLYAAELGLTPHRRGTKSPDVPKDDGWGDSDLLA